MAPLSQVIPSSLYSPSSGLCSSFLQSSQAAEQPALPASAPLFTLDSLADRFFQGGANSAGSPLIPSASEQKIKMYSPQFYQACTIGGILSCGLTHTMVTPMDVVKCNMQIDNKKYKSIGAGFSITAKEGGAAGLIRGWGPTFVGYSIQGAGKFGLYEFFKK